VTQAVEAARVIEKRRRPALSDVGSNHRFGFALSAGHMSYIDGMV